MKAKEIIMAELPSNHKIIFRRYHKIELIIAFLILLAGNGFKTSAIEVIKFTGEVIINSDNGGNLMKRTITFETLVADQCWSVTTRNSETNGDSALAYEVVSYDGTNAYWYAQLNKKATNSTNTSLGSIAECKTPPILGQCDAFLPWMATASYTYFDVEEPGVAKDIWTLIDPEARNNKNKIKISRFGKPPYLPEYVEFYSDGILRAMDIRTQRIIRRPYPKPYDQGFITRLYFATNFVNITGRWYPKVFELQAFKINLGKITASEDAQHTNQVFEQFEVARGEIHNIQTLDGHISDFVPRTDGNTYTTDGRVAIPNVLPNGITYININKNGLWPSKNSKFIQSILERELKARGLFKDQTVISGGKKSVLLILMTIAALLPLLVICWHYLFRR